MKRSCQIAWLIGVSCVFLLACREPEEVAITAVRPTHTLTPHEMMTETAVSPSTTPTNTPLQTATATSTLPPTETPAPVPTVTPPIGQAFVTLEMGQEARLEVVNQIGGAVTAVSIQNNLAYVGIGSRLAVADVSEPTEPRVISWSGVLPGVAEQIILRDELAYVALGEAGLWILDISDPLALKPIGHVQTTNPARHFLLQDNLVYAVDTDGPLEIEQFLSVVDMSDPMQPVEISTLPLPVRSSKLAIVNDYLYISIYPHHADYENTLWVVNIFDPFHPELINTIPDLAGRDIAINGNLLFAAEGEGLIVGDVSDPQNPVKISQSPRLIDYGQIQTLYVHRDTAWVIGIYGDLGGCDVKLYTLDISEPNNIQQVGELSVDCSHYEMVSLNGLFYLTDGYQMIDISNTAHHTEYTLVGELSTISSMRQLLMGDYLYGLSGDNIYVFDLINQVQPQMVGVYESEYSINDTTIAGSQLYLATYWQGIAAIDMTDPANPEETAVTDPEYHAENSYNLVLSDNRLYASLNGNLGIFDPATLQWIGGDGEEMYGRYNSFVVENNTLWTWAGTDEGYGLLTIDVTNPEQVVESGFLNQEERWQLKDWIVNQGFVYYLTGQYCDPDNCYGDYALKVIDATNFAQIRTVATLPTTSEIKHITLSGNLLVLTGDDVWLVDISDPTQPHFVGYFPTPGYSQDAVVVDDLIYVADGAGGLLVLRLVE